MRCLSKNIIRRILCLMMALTLSVSLMSAYVSKAQAEDLAFEQSIAEFPESYKVFLRQLHETHPNWSFVPFHVEPDWAEVMTNQMKLSRNVVPNGTMGTNGRWYKTPTSWKSTVLPGAYNWAQNQWVELVGGNWVQASEEAVAYVMDPRNWLTETNIFAFEQLGFNESYHTYDTLKAMMENTFMDCDYATVGGSDGKTYATVLLEAGKAVGVSPIHLCTRLFQEKGKGVYDANTGQYILTDTLATGQVGTDGVTYYNFFNIQANGNTEEQVLANGLREAQSQGWDSQYKSIVGGVEKVLNGYIEIGQDTIYFQKFSVVNPKYYYWKQYMQNLLCPINEGYNTRQVYVANDILESPFVFRIPVYKNMPETPCPEPTPKDTTANPNYKLSGITVNGMTLENIATTHSLTPSFNMDTDAYSIIVPYEVNKITIGATAIASNTSTITGTGEHELVVGKNTIQVVCTSEYGTSKTYTININRSEGSMYLTGLSTSAGSFVESFDKFKYEYNMTVDNSVEALDVFYATESQIASVEYRNNDTVIPVTNGKIPQIELVEGLNTINIDIYPSANDRTMKKTYTIKVVKYTKTTIKYKDLQYNKDLMSINGFAMGDTVETAINRLEVYNGSLHIRDKAGNIKANDSIIATGDKLWLVDNNGYDYKSYDILLYGDVNGDGKIDLFDFAYVKKMILENTGLTGIYLEAGDTYEASEGINLFDFAIIKKYILEKVEIPQLRVDYVPEPEPPTEAPTQAPTEPPTQAPTELPTEPETTVEPDSEAPTEPSNESESET